MPRFAPAADKNHLLACIAATLAKQTDFLEQEDIDLDNEDSLLRGLEQAVSAQDEFLPAIVWKDLSKITFSAENVCIQHPEDMNQGTELHGIITRP